MDASNPKERVPQAQRREAMKARLLKATLDVILEEGWAQASTQKICARAGVSRGAQTHHYPTKADLLLAAVRQIVISYQAEIDEEASLPVEGAWSLEKLFTLLWEACLQDGLMESWIEAMVAARTDKMLSGAVAEMDTTSITAMRQAGETAMEGNQTSKEVAADIIELTVYLLRGMVLQRGVHPDETTRIRLYTLWKSMAEARLRTD